MQHKRKNESYSRPSRRPSAVPLPDVVDIDTLASMRDEDLVLRFRTLDEERTRAYQHGVFDLQPWEVEIAYVKREQHIRRVRRDNYYDVERKAREDFESAEASLPEGEFDNSAFIYAATGGRLRWN